MSSWVGAWILAGVNQPQLVSNLPVLLHMCSFMFVEMGLLQADYSPVIRLEVVWQGSIWVYHHHHCSFVHFCVCEDKLFIT